MHFPHLVDMHFPSFCCNISIATERISSQIANSVLESHIPLAMHVLYKQAQ